MSTLEVTFVRIYVTEGKAKKEQILECLHDQEKVRGVTVFRGVAGFGQSGHMHSSSLLATSMDLPLVVEFFDEPQRVAAILKHLRGRVKPGHIVSWNATLYL